MKKLKATKSGKFWFIFSIWFFISGVVSYFLWKTVQYWRRLLGHPYLPPHIVPSGLKEILEIEEKARIIATANLQSSIEKRELMTGEEKLVICAGVRNFREPWARDLGFANYGLAELKEFQVIKESLEVFLINQKPSGQFPVKVHSTNVVDRYLYSLFKREQPIHVPLKPKYSTAHNTISLDGNALLVIAALHYIKRSGDQAFARRHWLALKQAIAWVEGHALEADGLLHQGAFTDWADSIARTGRVLYTNVVYWKALHDLAQVAANYGQSEDVDYYESRAEHLKQSINDYFWRDELGYYITSHHFNNLNSDGNLLAVAWRLTEAQQAHSILDKMAEFEMADPVPTQVVNMAYPNRYVAIENRLGGIGHYHTHAAWLWLGAWHIIALSRMERLAEAETLLQRMSAAIARDGVVHEVYDQTGYHLSSFWYTSEAPLTWSAGMFIYAYHTLQRHYSGSGNSSGA